MGPSVAAATSNAMGFLEGTRQKKTKNQWIPGMSTGMIPDLYTYTVICEILLILFWHIMAYLKHLSGFASYSSSQVPTL